MKYSRSKFIVLTACLTFFLSCNEKNDDTSAPISDDVVMTDDISSDDEATMMDDDEGSESDTPIDISEVNGFDQEVDDLEDWELIFQDEFETDLSNWTIWDGGAFNNELQHYQEDNLILGDGYLFIRGRRQNVTGFTTPFDPTLKNFDFSSGRIESVQSYSAGNTEGATKLRISARILLDEGIGLWPAFWTYGDPWPTQGEIDILEFRGNDTDSYVTNFFYGTAPGQVISNPSQTTQNIPFDGNLTQQWHVFELIWSEDTFEMLFDGEVKYVYTETEWNYMDDIYNKSQRVILNMAIGGDFFQPNVNPDDIPNLSYTVIDWVRVYKQ